MSKNKTEEKTINVFITHRHKTGTKYLDKCREFITECFKLSESGAENIRFITDAGDLVPGDDYSVLNDYYDITDLDVVILSEGANSKWIVNEINEMQKRGVAVLPLWFEGDDINDVKPEILDCMWIDLRDGKKPTEKQMQGVARKLAVTDNKAHKSKAKSAKKIFKSDKNNSDSIKLITAVKKGISKGVSSFVSKLVTAVLIVLFLAVLLTVMGETVDFETIKNMFLKSFF